VYSTTGLSTTVPFGTNIISAPWGSLPGVSIYNGLPNYGTISFTDAPTGVYRVIISLTSTAGTLTPWVATYSSQIDEVDIYYSYSHLPVLGPEAGCKETGRQMRVFAFSYTPDGYEAIVDFAATYTSLGTTIIEIIVERLSNSHVLASKLELPRPKLSKRPKERKLPDIEECHLVVTEDYKR
jgi:hypothetical protein